MHPEAGPLKKAGTCSVCGAALRSERVTYTQAVGEAPYVVRNVPAEACPRDGEQYFAPIPRLGAQ